MFFHFENTYHCNNYFLVILCVMFWSHVEYFCVFTFVAYLFLNGGKIRTGLDYFDKKNLEWKGENKDAQITNISFFFEAEDSCRGVIHFDMSYLHREKVKHIFSMLWHCVIVDGSSRRSQPEISPERFLCSCHEIYAS